MVTVLAYDPVAFTVATTLKVAVAPLLMVPMLQVGELQVPAEGVALTSVYPAGRDSVRLTPDAPHGPLFPAVMVKVTLLPTFGVLLLADFVTTRSEVAPAGVFITTSADAAEVQPVAELVTVKL